MRFSIVFTEAEKDVALAVDWYSEQKAGLGKLFLHALNETIEKIIIYPRAYKKIYKQVRQAGLKKFPYVVLYTIDGNLITVYCIFHTSQNPRKKIKRLRK